LKEDDSHEDKPDLGDEDLEEEESGSLEAAKVKRMLDPKLPSQSEVDEHMMTHLPYRNWCEHCVKGRGRQMDHRRKQQKSEMVEFHMDFCFPGGELDAKTQTILVIRERTTRMTMASAVPSKSTGTFIAKRGVAFMKEVGSQFGTVILKSDQEPAIKAVVDEMCKVRAADSEVRTEVVQNFGD